MKIIATSDWHLSTVKPTCRIDEDWIKTQQEHLERVAELSAVYRADVVVAGDVFDTPIVNPAASNLVHKFVMELPTHVSFVVGNHDVSYHSMANYQSSSLAGVWYGNNKPIEKIALLHFGTTEVDGDKNADILALHTFAVPDENHRVLNRDCVTAQELVDRYPQYRIIIVGDNHQHWAKKIGEHLVVNCGTLMQRTAAEAKKPCGFYVVDTVELTAEYQDMSDFSTGCIDLTYLENIKEREESKAQYDAMINHVVSTQTETCSFLEELEKFERNADWDVEVKKAIAELVMYLKKEN